MFLKTILMANLFLIDNPDHIHDLKWKNRILIIKINKKVDFSIKINRFIKEFDERNFIIVYLKNQNTYINDIEMSKHFSKSILNKIKNTNSDHNFILIGKDGKLKKSYPSKIEIEEIIFDVDKMPMRRYEMETRKNMND